MIVIKRRNGLAEGVVDEHLVNSTRSSSRENPQTLLVLKTVTMKNCGNHLPVRLKRPD
jgi:hypothetical protein